VLFKLILYKKINASNKVPRVAQNKLVFSLILYTND